MKPGHTKNHTADPASLQKLLRAQQTDLDDLAINEMGRICEPPRYTPTKLQVRNSYTPDVYRRTYTEGDKKLQFSNTMKPNLVYYQAKKEEGFTNPETYRELLTENRKLAAELGCFKEREAAYKAKIATLENEKGLLIQALEKAQLKLNEMATKAKEDKKRMNIIIDSFKQSIQHLSKSTCNQETQTSEDTLSLASTRVHSNSTSIEAKDEFPLSKRSLHFQGSLTQELIDENIKVKNELLELKMYSETLQNYIEHMKTQIKKQESVQYDLIEKGKLLYRENRYFKNFIQSLIQNPVYDEAPENVKDYPNGEKGSTTSKRVTNRMIPSYIKALGLSMTERDSK